MVNVAAMGGVRGMACFHYCNVYIFHHTMNILNHFDHWFYSLNSKSSNIVDFDTRIDICQSIFDDTSICMLYFSELIYFGPQFRHYIGFSVILLVELALFNKVYFLMISNVYRYIVTVYQYAKCLRDAYNHSST